MLLLPISLGVPVESEDWEDFSLWLTRDFFRQHSECGSAVLMLVPRPARIPLIAAVDEYDDEDTVRQALDVFESRSMVFRKNSCDQIVLIFPIDIIDEPQKDRAFSMLKGIADGLGAVAVSVIAECLVRRLKKPSDNVPGTGDDGVMVVVERVGRETTASVAPIAAGEMGAFEKLPGTVRGRLCGWLTQEEETETPAGFTAKVNVSTVGEA